MTTTDLRPINGISPERRGYLFWTSNDFVEQAIVRNLSANMVACLDPVGVEPLRIEGR